MRFQRGFLAFLAVAVVVGSAAELRAAALLITPASGTLNVSRWTGPQNSQSQIDTAIAPIINGATELYKQNVGEAIDTGAGAAYYSTTFANSPTDPEDAYITWVGPTTWINPVNSFLLLKDGKQTPAWYLFSLQALGWTGNQNLDLQDFWIGNGAISHVTIYGGGTVNGDPLPPFISDVPEPASIAMWLTMAVGGAFVARRKSKKAVC